MVSVFNFQDGPTYRCLFPEQPDANSIPSCAEAGVLGVLPGIIGCWQATEAIKVLTGLGNPLSGKVLIYNALKQNIRTLELHALPESRVISKLPETSYSCSSESLLKRKEKPFEEISEEYLKSLLDDGEDILLLDVREDWERIQYSIRPSFHQPLGSLISDSIVSPIDELNTQKKIVVYCKAGVRSRVACEALQSIGYKNLLNLSGGIDGWKQAFPEYNGNA
jgi:rhodanese-related sulfurtransferase